jgi:hypothetical protein
MMISHLQFGGYHSSATKLLNCLIASILFATLAFAALPGFLPLKSRNKGATHAFNATVPQTKLMTYRNKANPIINTVTNPQKTKKPNLATQARLRKSLPMRGKPVSALTSEFQNRGFGPPGSAQHTAIEKISKASGPGPTKIEEKQMKIRSRTLSTKFKNPDERVQRQ